MPNGYPWIAAAGFGFWWNECLRVVWLSKMQQVSVCIMFGKFPQLNSHQKSMPNMNSTTDLLGFNWKVPPLLQNFPKNSKRKQHFPVFIPFLRATRPPRCPNLFPSYCPLCFHGLHLNLQCHLVATWHVDLTSTKTHQGSWDRNTPGFQFPLQTGTSCCHLNGDE